MSTFVVDPTQQALVLRFGQPVRDLIGAPGLYFKWPFVDTVVYIDKRILALDDERAGGAGVRQPAARGRRLRALSHRRSAAVLSIGLRHARRRRAARRHVEFRASADLVGGLDHRHRARQARRADGRHPRPDDRGRQALRPRRRRRAHQARRPAGGKLRGGVPPHADRAAAARGVLSRARVAAVPADQGGGRPQGDGDHRQAQQQAEQIRGEGDGERNRIFAEAYGADPDFFAFYRSMQAYENSFADGRTRALISPKSDFFRYFSTPTPAPGMRRRQRRRQAPRLQRRRTDMRDWLRRSLVLAIKACLRRPSDAWRRRLMRSSS